MNYVNRFLMDVGDIVVAETFSSWKVFEVATLHTDVVTAVSGSVKEVIKGELAEPKDNTVTIFGYKTILDYNEITHKRLVEKYKIAKTV